MEQLEEFSVSVGFREGFRIMVVRGEVDEFTAPALDALLNEDRADGRVVVVDRVSAGQRGHACSRSSTRTNRLRSSRRSSRRSRA
jgi:hypothetical protein